MLLLEAARRFGPVDPELARETYLEALTAAIFAGPLAGPGASSREVAEAARAAPPTRAPRAPDLLLDGLVALLTDTYVAAVPTLREASASSGRRQSRRSSGCAGCGERPSQHCMFGTTKVGTACQTSTFSSSARPERSVNSPIALSHRGQMHVLAGELALAASDEEALQEATVLTGNPLAPTTGWSHGHAGARGRNETVDRHGSCRADRSRRRAGLSFIDWAQAVLYNGTGRYAEALEAARRVVGTPSSSP